MIVLLLIMIWLSMLCNLWLLFRINMLDDSIEKMYKQRSKDVKSINIINEHNSKNIDVLAKQLEMKIKKEK